MRDVPSASMPLPGSPPTPTSIMTKEQEEHLQRVLHSFAMRCEKKYRRGQSEHGGDLHHHSASILLDAAIDEAIDQVVYLITLKEVLGT